MSNGGAGKRMTSIVRHPSRWNREAMSRPSNPVLHSPDPLDQRSFGLLVGLDGMGNSQPSGSSHEPVAPYPAP
jgi:hypothetical protein